MDTVMYYTIDKLVLLKNDKEMSIKPKDYKDENKVIGDELIAFMTGHLGDMSWKLGATTGYGPHSFMLTMFPTIDNLRFWIQAQRMNGEVRVDCSGGLEVVIKGERLTPPPGADVTVPKQEKVIVQRNLEQFVRNRIKRLFR